MLFIYLVISNTVKIKLANDPFGFGHLFLKIITNYSIIPWKCKVSKKSIFMRRDGSKVIHHTVATWEIKDPVVMVPEQYYEMKKILSFCCFDFPHSIINLSL